MTQRGVSVRSALPLLTRFSEPLLPHLPAQDEDPLLERLRAPEPARLRDPAERDVRVDPVAHEPASDRDAGPATAGPAVDVDEPPGLELGVDLVERGDEPFAGGDGEVANGEVQVSSGRLDESGVRFELSLLREVEEERDSRGCELLHLCPGVLRSVRARVPSGDEPSGLDDGRRAHVAEVCRVAIPRPGGALLIRLIEGADSPGMAPPDTSAIELRDRALTLASELGVDPGAWYIRVLEEEKKEGLEPDLGALVRVYWELQRVTGSADLRDTWRALADQLWSGEAA